MGWGVAPESGAERGWVHSQVGTERASGTSSRGTPPRPCVVRVRQAQQAPRPPSQVILGLEEADSFLWEPMSASPRPRPLPGRVTWKDVTVNGGGSAGGRGYPQSRGTMWCLREDRDSCHLWCGGHLPSLNLEQTALLGELPQVLATASSFSLAPGLPHLTQLPWVHGGANRAAEVPQEVTGVGESAQHTEAGRAVGVGHQPLVRALGCAD